MIIQIRGTSGSGKTWVMRRLMDLIPRCVEAGEPFEAVYVAPRKRPLYYKRGERPYKVQLVLGHYETACGGCDTIGSAREVYELIDRADYDDLLCEGLLLSEDTKWTLELHRQTATLHILFLTTYPEQCLRQIEARRQEAGNNEPLNPNNTLNRVRTIERARVKLTEAGVYCRRATANQAPQIILNWLGYSWPPLLPKS